MRGRDEGSDTSSETFDAILGIAFPHLFELIEGQVEDEDERSLTAFL